jgi:iron complex outermembrane receptor protein
VDTLEESNDLEGHTLHLTLEAGGHIFKSITARRTYDGNKPGDFDGGSYSAPLFVAENSESQEQFSQELQVSSDFQDSRWRYVAGLYYFEEETSVNNPQTFTVRVGADSFGDPLLLTLTNTLLYTTDNNASAIYGQVAYRPPVLDDRLEVSVGLRYTEDEKQASLLSRSASGKKDWSSTNPSLIVNYALSDDINLYANISTGYNSGQFNLRATTADIFAEPVDEEEVVNYELGLKSEWLSRRLRLNASLFQMDYTDLQVNQFRASETGASSIVTNAGEATITGFEIETLYLLNEHITLNANWGYTDFEYDEFITSFNVETGESVDEADRARPVLAPENTGSAGVAYNRQLEGVGTLDARLDVTYTSGYDFNPFLTAYTRASSRTLLNARIGLGDIALLGDRSNLQFALWAKNLTDEKYRFNGIDFGVDSGALGFAGVTFGPRRTFGVDVIYEFE